MQSRTSLVIWMEVIWWIVTAIVVAGVLYPIWQSTVEYPFWTTNIIFIVVAITISRYIFLTKFTFLAKWKYFKIAIVCVTLPFIFLLIEKLVGFQSYLDEEGLDSVLKNLAIADRESMFSYIRSQMLFFGTASVVAAIIMPIKMIISIWRNFNS